MLKRTPEFLIYNQWILTNDNNFLKKCCFQKNFKVSFQKIVDQNSNLLKITRPSIFDNKINKIQSKFDTKHKILLKTLNRKNEEMTNALKFVEKDILNSKQLSNFTGSQFNMSIIENKNLETLENNVRALVFGSKKKPKLIPNIFSNKKILSTSKKRTNVKKSIEKCFKIEHFSATKPIINNSPNFQSTNERRKGSFGFIEKVKGLKDNKPEEDLSVLNILEKIRNSHKSDFPDSTNMVDQNLNNNEDFNLSNKKDLILSENFMTPELKQVLDISHVYRPVDSTPVCDLTIKKSKNSIDFEKKDDKNEKFCFQKIPLFNKTNSQNNNNCLLFSKNTDSAKNLEKLIQEKLNKIPKKGNVKKIFDFGKNTKNSQVVVSSQKTLNSFTLSNNNGENISKSNSTSSQKNKFFHIFQKNKINNQEKDTIQKQAHINIASITISKKSTVKSVNNFNKIEIVSLKKKETEKNEKIDKIILKGANIIQEFRNKQQTRVNLKNGFKVLDKPRNSDKSNHDFYPRTPLNLTLSKHNSIKNLGELNFTTDGKEKEYTYIHFSKNEKKVVQSNPVSFFPISLPFPVSKNFSEKFANQKKYSKN